MPKQHAAIDAGYRAITRDIEVSVEPRFLEEQSRPESSQYFWAYTIEIANHGAETVQLRTRHWRITDGHGRLQEVRGPGVVGEQPILAPGDSFIYTSGCPLETPDGVMVGAYRMMTEAGDEFDVDIPAFSLDSPHSKRVLN
jgi:ApaG protein